MSSRDEGYAASMIRRFRESKPTSRSDRELAREAGELQQMWWVDDDITNIKDGNKRFELSNESYSKSENLVDFPRYTI
jgi:hypothetical protein